MISASNMTVSRAQEFNPLLEQFLTFSQSFGKSDLTAMAGFSVQSFQYTNNGASGSQLPDGVTIKTKPHCVLCLVVSAIAMITSTS